MQVRHTVTQEGAESIHTFDEIVEEGEFKPIERLYGDDDAMRFLKSTNGGFGFTSESAERVIKAGTA